MKKLITTIGVAAMLATANAQDTNTPSFIASPLWGAVTGTNFMFATYGISGRDEAGKSVFGGGVGLIYNFSQFAGAVVRLDAMDHQVWMPNGNFQLQAPVTLFGKLTAVPFIFTGIATPIGGKGGHNGEVVGIFGAGLAVRLPEAWRQGKWYVPNDVVWDMERWTPVYNTWQHRWGLLWRF